VADALLRCGYNVSAWTRTPRTREGVRCLAGAAQLREFAGRLDVLVCLLPLTDDTRCVCGGGVCGAHLHARCWGGCAGGCPTAALGERSA
jgi:glyoxylate/hydroxypyruvate reductase A